MTSTRTLMCGMRDEFAPSWWTLADAAGNEVDIATTTGRD